jgi:pimeloyl-ACP methyl ester carboxylesterase
MSNFNLRGIPHFYDFISSESKSSSPVLVFIHGWLLSHRYWYPLVEKLKLHYSCLIYDLRGFGDSQLLSTHRSTPEHSLEKAPHFRALESQYSLATYAEDLDKLLTKLNIEEAWLIGHSLGGSIAIWGADICKDRIKGVICVNAGGGIYLKEEFQRFRNAGENLVKFRPHWLSSVPFLDLLFARLMVARPLCRHWGRQRIIDFVKASEEAAIGSLLDSTTEEEVHLLPQIVSRLSQPAYFFAGDQDMVMEAKYVRHLASFHHLFNPHGTNVIELPDCGHFAMLEQSELLQEKIVQIINKYN